jgi:hypothetical protein
MHRLRGVQAGDGKTPEVFLHIDCIAIGIDPV